MHKLWIQKAEAQVIHHKVIFPPFCHLSYQEGTRDRVSHKDLIDAF